jgi:hypothetical protein
MAEEEEIPYSVTYLDGDNEEGLSWIKRQGKARVQYANGDVFEGFYDANQKRKGKGTYTYKGEDQITTAYEGDWVNGLKEGYGTQTYPDGSRYLGQFEAGMIHGDGSYIYQNGDVYSGSWNKGKKEGFGTYLFKENDSSFKGKWENGNILEGCWIHKDGTVWDGTFAGGRPCGYGTFSFKNGNVQSGEYIEQNKRSHPTDEFATIPVWLGEQVSRKTKK